MENLVHMHKITCNPLFKLWETFYAKTCVAGRFICCTWRDMRIAAGLDLPVLAEENPLSSWQYKLLRTRRFDFAERCPIMLWVTGFWFWCKRNAHAYPNRTRKKTSRSDNRIGSKHAAMSGSGWSPHVSHLALLWPRFPKFPPHKQLKTWLMESQKMLWSRDTKKERTHSHSIVQVKQVK